MKNQEKYWVLLYFVFWASTFVYGQDCDPKPQCILVINPFTKILCPIDPLNPVDVKISKFNLAREIYDVLSLDKKRYKCIDLRSTFDNLLDLSVLLKDLNAKEFIESFLPIVKYTPDIFGFASIDKETGVVVLKAEILDISLKSRVSIRRISFGDFLVDRLLHNEVKNLTEDLISCHKPCCGFLSLEELMKTLDGLTYGIGMGLGYGTWNELTLENIPRELRTIPPHPDDVLYRGHDILPVNIPDNYLVRENSVDINFGQRLSLDIIQISYLGIVNISVRTTSIKELGQLLNQNLYRKWYVTNNVSDPENPNSGTAYIYYGIKSKNRAFFDSKSFSLPLSITYPVLYAGRKKELICKLLGGTNILLPDKIELETEKGWYRFGEYEIQNGGKSSIGDLKEIEWFAGIDIEGSLSKTLRLDFQFARVYSYYEGDFNVPLSFKQQEHGTTSLRINLIRMF